MRGIFEGSSARTGEAALVPVIKGCICLKGACMPSMAEEVETEVNTLRWRTTGSRIYGLASDSLELMAKV